MGYSFQLAARVLLYTPSHKHDSTYHSLCYTIRGALVGMRNSSNDPPWMIDPTTHRTTSDRSHHGATSRSTAQWVHDEWSIRRPIAPRSNAPTTELHLAPQLNESTMNDRSDDPSHHDRTLLPRSYISLHSSMSPRWMIDPTTHRTTIERSYHGATSRSTAQWVDHEGSIRRPIAPRSNAPTTELHLAPQLNESTMNDRSDDPSHHDRTLLPRSYISLHSSMSRPWRIDPTTHRTTSDRSYHGATSRTTAQWVDHEGSIRRPIAPRATAPTTELHLAPQLNESTMKDRSDDPSHHDRTLLPRSYISLHSSMSPRWMIDPTTHRTTIERSYHGATSRSTAQWVDHEGSIRRPIAPRATAPTTELHLAPQLNESTMKDRSDDPSHHERPLLPRSYISLHSSMSRPWRIDPTTHRTTSDRSYHGATSRSTAQWVDHEGWIRRPIAPRATAPTTALHLAPQLNESTMKDRSDDPSHHERPLLPRRCEYDRHRDDSPRTPCRQWRAWRGRRPPGTSTWLRPWSRTWAATPAVCTRPASCPRGTTTSWSTPSTPTQ